MCFNFNGNWTGKRGKTFGSNSLITGLIIGGATAVVAPVTVPAALGVLGFTSAGIAAGSFTASFMASYGGAVASGSACAIAQSIGAAGIGTAATAASAATATVVGLII
ncbi:hypothetical protein KUTeg_003632 [Tegillarca granosa]|uniref:ISG12 protein n=1 Tax=Tegillarca granosa TaxID=220873 RepID=A0ABQ9FPB1_TEGGR|nr:hypothetical protein KUTeg_003632 [Tegillarca granosa]